MSKGQVFAVAVAGAALFYALRPAPAPGHAAALPLSEHDAFLLCREAITKHLKPSGEAQVPFTDNWGGGGSDFYFAWTGSRPLIRASNGAGRMDSLHEADCWVNGRDGFLSGLKIDAKTIR
jgi:hypothetical protein